MTTIAVSDAHLDITPEGQKRFAAFLSFLRSIDPRQVNRIIILGDLFDFWFEYRHVIFSGYFEILRALADLRDGGVAFHFVCGNHDFWAGRFLEQELRFTIHRDPVTLDFGGQRVLLVHGDGINPKDWSYRLYRRIARARPVIWLFGFLHPDWAMALARVVSKGSRRLTQRGAAAEGRALRAFAQEILARGDADVVMCGHSHDPVCEPYPTPTGTGLYVNTGDWLSHQSYVEWDGREFRVRLFREERPQPETGAEAQRPEQQGEKQP